MASSAFSFHCMICFEEFDPHSNYPVVLPCGHTYVCIACASRLDKCMECRMPLTMKVELPPPPPPTTSAASAGVVSPHGDIVPSASSSDTVHKENQHNAATAATTISSSRSYAERVRNSPGFRRRYGERAEYRDSYKRRDQQPPTPTQQLPKQRLPLPKNAVLLSLIQAAEPARRRAEVEAPPTPQKPQDDSKHHHHNLLQTSRSAEEKLAHQNVTTPTKNNTTVLPKYARPSPLFINGSSSGEHDAGCPSTSGTGGSGSSSHHHHLNLTSTSTTDDEEHKIRVGTYLEGGPCGTYAVAVKGGLLVYPTLFEHTLPSALNGLQQEEEDVVKRDVEKMVKAHRASIIQKDRKSNSPKQRVGSGKQNKSSASIAVSASFEQREGMKDSLVEAWAVECSNDDENVEAVIPDQSKSKSSEGSSGCFGSSSSGKHTPSHHGRILSDPGVRQPAGPLELITMAASNELQLVGDASSNDLSPGSTDSALFPDDEHDEHVGNIRQLHSFGSAGEPTGGGGGEGGDLLSGSVRTVPAGRSASTSGEDNPSSPNKIATRFMRHLSHGGYDPRRKGGSSNNDKNKNDEKRETVDEFERPLIRLKYGDRVQVVSMDSRGWVKLARGYGYIRLENDKQLVKGKCILL